MHACRVIMVDHVSLAHRQVNVQFAKMVFQVVEDALRPETSRSVAQVYSGPLLVLCLQVMTAIDVLPSCSDRNCSLQLR